MALSYKNIIDDRLWKSLTGLSQNQFMTLEKYIAQAYTKDGGVGIEQAALNLKKKFTLPTYADCLFFVLYQLKSGLTFDALGFSFDMPGAQAQQNFSRCLVLLREALSLANCLPKRHFENIDDFQKYMENHPELLVDVTEEAIQRPDNQEVQKTYYSGKKKSHTVKELIISTPDKVILYISNIYKGTAHDFAMLKSELPPGDWLADKIVRLDSGFQGIASLYKCKKLYLPVKKKRVAKGEDNSLTEEQKEQNREQASHRIVVEHSIGGVKRYRILSNRIRIKIKNNTLNDVIGVCAGLWNFSLLHK